jgi:hypothetical protein
MQEKAFEIWDFSAFAAGGRGEFRDFLYILLDSIYLSCKESFSS